MAFSFFVKATETKRKQTRMILYYHPRLPVSRAEKPLQSIRKNPSETKIENHRDEPPKISRVNGFPCRSK
jgi:hypothetical protein